jgi:hypothetical protein
MKQEYYLLCDDAWCAVLQKDMYDAAEIYIILFVLNHYHPATWVDLSAGSGLAG